MAASVQEGTGAVAAGLSYPVTLANPSTAGNVIVLGSGNNQGALAGVSQTGVTWASAKNAGFNFGTDLWIGVVGPGAGSIITVTLPASGRGVAVAQEWSGLLTSVDQSSLAHGTSTSILSGSVTPSQDNAIIFALGVAFTTITGGPTGGFTNILSPASSASFNVALAFLAQGPAAPAQAAWTIASNPWDGAIIALLQAPDVPAGTPDITVSSILTDGFVSTHRPPWFSPQNRLGRLNSAGQPFAIAFAVAGTSAEATLGTGAANDTSSSIAVQAGLASGAGLAPSAAIANIAASPAAAAGTGAASGASDALGPTSQAAAGSGAVQVSSRSIAASMGQAAGTGLAANAATTSSSPSSVIAAALMATGSGSAGDIDALVAVPAPAVTGTGAAANAAPAVSPNAGALAPVATAFAPSVAVKANAGVATGTGTAWIAADAVAVAAQAASGSGSAKTVGLATEAHPTSARGTGRGLSVLAAGPTVHGGPPPSIAMVVTIRSPLEIT